MNELLTQLGVPANVQEFFQTGELLFHYGTGDTEQYADGIHRVPTTNHLWVAGSPVAREIIILPSAMEAIAYLTFNRHCHRQLNSLCFIATGNLPKKAQLRWIGAQFRHRKFILAFSHDLIGKITDVWVAAGLRGQWATFHKMGEWVDIRIRHAVYRFPANTLSLNLFEKATAMRTGCKTCKPKIFNTFLDQLRYDNNT